MSDEVKKEFVSKKVNKKISPTVKSTKKVSVTFKDMRKFDLHVGREMITFQGRDTKSIPAEWLRHPDFVQVSKYFVIKGV